MAKVLVTGATGFIGRRLIHLLLQHGHVVYALVRIKGAEIFATKPPNLHLLYGDLRDSNALNNLPNDIDAAYYLMHSMSDISSGLLATEKRVAENFVAAVKKTKIAQVIYLGGIIDEKELSPHLAARKMVEQILSSSQIPTTVLRASIIIGAGSASFEIIRDLVEKLPVMVAPKWVNNQCQPIAVYDVLYYLQHVLLNKACFGKTFDIGGPNVLTFKEALLAFAKMRGLKRAIIGVPVLTPRLSSYWLVFITSVPFSLASYLVQSMQAKSVCHENEIQKIVPHVCLNYEEAVRRAFEKTAQNEVTSTWMDSWEVFDDDPDIQKYIQVPSEAVLIDKQVMALTVPFNDAIEKIWSIGGNNGWYCYEWAWNMRGYVDKFVGGVGRNRGRRHPSELLVGDSIDFWRVLKADKASGHLILYAEMKLPGEAWLEFKIQACDEGGYSLVQTATFRPKGLLGRLYWYLLVPFHFFIFGKMARSIAQRTKG
jgi:uncharacterized protein YbjT (DUF2867 family)